MSQSAIAEQFGVTRAYISWIKHTYGGKLTPKEVALQHWPWDVREAHTRTAPYQRLRDHVEYMATGGKGMTDAKVSRLESWWSAVEYVVVMYDEDYPSTPNIKHGGFHYEPRTVEDGDLLIRIPGVELTPEARALFLRPGSVVN